MSNERFVKDLKAIFDENPQIHEINGKTYSSVPLSVVEERRFSADNMRFNSLKALVTMIKAESANFHLPLYINVKSHTEVTVFDSLDDRMERQIPFTAVSDGCPFEFGRGYDYEAFVIALRSLFVQNSDLQRLLELLSKLSNINSVESEDDGITQRVTASTGTSLNKTVQASPIWTLSPFRTFREVQQPASDFLFRISNGNRFALYEADGGAWKIAARQRIIDYFEFELADEIKNGNIIVVG
jgi:hypothetical protein